jgi:hypothetical protein
MDPRLLIAGMTELKNRDDGAVAQEIFKKTTQPEFTGQ